MDTTRTSELIAQLTEALSVSANHDPSYAVVLADIGRRLHQAGLLEAALASFEEALRLDVQKVAYWHALATLRMQLGLPQAALEACNKALELNSENPDSLCNTAMVLEVLGQHDPALHCYDKVLALVPDHARALRNKPMCLVAIGRRDMAIQAAVDALKYYPEDAGLHFNLGELYLGTAEPLCAVAAYRSCLQLDAGFAFARYAMSIALAAAGQVKEAWTVQQAVLVEHPNLPLEYKSPIRTDEASGIHDVAPARVAVLAIADEFQRYDWRSYIEGIRLFTELTRGEHACPALNSKEAAYLSLLLPAPMDSTLRLQLARQIALRISDNVTGMTLVRPPRKRREKIRIAYFGTCFKRHPAAQLLGDIFVRHCRTGFEVYAYAMGPGAADAERRRVREAVDAFRDIEHLPAQAAAQMILNDEIDVLIDLTGYNRDTRSEVLALRPAPVQVNYLDFMGTRGAAFIDYTLLDRTTLTAQERSYWDEKIVYLPHCSYHCERPTKVASTLSRSQLGLPEVGVIFGALPHPRKLEPLSVRLWFEILLETPGSVLWLLHETQEQVDSLSRLAHEVGLDPQRLVFAPFKLQAEFLAGLGQVDIHLDCLIYNGHTTTVDVLSMGVPMVTVTGETVVSRVATTMLTAHGLPELVAKNSTEYKALVWRLVHDKVWYADIKRRALDLAAAGGNLFCPERRVREMETAYRMMWERHQAGLPPADFDVPEYRPA